MKTAIKSAVLALCGGCIYFAIEIMWRGYSHWTMAVLGGICFVLIGQINEIYEWEMPLFEQVLLGASGITVLELVAGLVLNVWLGLGVWDYSQMPLNLLGQICPQYFVAWNVLALVAIVLDDWLRYWLFHEDKPHYTIW